MIYQTQFCTAENPGFMFLPSSTYNKWDLPPPTCIILSYFTLLGRLLQDLKKNKNKK